MTTSKYGCFFRPSNNSDIGRNLYKLCLRTIINFIVIDCGGSYAAMMSIFYMYSPAALAIECTTRKIKISPVVEVVMTSIYIGANDNI